MNIKNGIDLLGISNVPREIGRSIERLPDGKGSNGFGVTVSKKQMQGTSRYNRPSIWVNYKLEKTEANKKGIEKMRIYVAEQKADTPTKKTTTVKEHTRSLKKKEENNNSQKSLF